jgi:hypothetical protein
MLHGHHISKTYAIQSMSVRSSQTHVRLSTFSKFGYFCSKGLYSLEGHRGLPHLSYVPHLGDSIQSSTGLEYILHLAARAESNQLFKKSKSMTEQVLTNRHIVQLACIEECLLFLWL